MIRGIGNNPDNPNNLWWDSHICSVCLCLLVVCLCCVVSVKYCMLCLMFCVCCFVSSLLCLCCVASVLCLCLCCIGSVSVLCCVCVVLCYVCIVSVLCYVFVCLCVFINSLAPSLFCSSSDRIVSAQVGPVMRDIQSFIIIRLVCILRIYDLCAGISH